MATRDAAGNPLFPDDADEHGYAVATLTGAVPFSPAPGFSGFTWNIPGVPLVGTEVYPAPDSLDDIGYIDLAIDAISDLICVDDRRVYAGGSSGGGRMASQLACDLSDRIAAIAPVMGVRAPRASDTPGFTVECAPVVLYDVLDGGHTLPGTLVVPALVPFVGPTNQEIDTADTVWSFLSRFRLRGPR